MILRFKFMALALLFLATSNLQAQNSSSALSASNILNPNISAVGWFQAETGHRQDENADPFSLKEIELAFQAQIDPYAKADIFVAIEEGEIDIEEGTISWLALPFHTSLKLGKFRTEFGKFNRIHAGETAFATKPFAHEAFFGEEGFSGTGASLSWLIPNPIFFTQLTLEGINTPEGDEVPAFDQTDDKKMTYNSRLESFFDLTNSLSGTLGINYANGPAGEEYDAVANSSDTLRTELMGTDVLFKWKNPRTSFLRSHYWRTEILWSKRELTSSNHEYSMGLFSHLELQLARRWSTGGRIDYSETPIDKSDHEQGGLIYFTFHPSEFSSISLQGQHKNFDDSRTENLGFLKVVFFIGPHGIHNL